MTRTSNVTRGRATRAGAWRTTTRPYERCVQRERRGGANPFSTHQRYPNFGCPRPVRQKGGPSRFVRRTAGRYGPGLHHSFRCCHCERARRRSSSSSSYHSSRSSSQFRRRSRRSSYRPSDRERRAASRSGSARRALEGASVSDRPLVGARPWAAAGSGAVERRSRTPSPRRATEACRITRGPRRRPMSSGNARVYPLWRAGIETAAIPPSEVTVPAGLTG